MVLTAKTLKNFLPIKSKKKLLKIAELYPTCVDSLLSIKEHHPGCIYYFIIDPNSKGSFESFETPCIYIPKDKIYENFPFIEGEIDIYISPEPTTESAFFLTTANNDHKRTLELY